MIIRDAQSNIMASYTQTNTQEIALEEQPIYGSSRLGVYHPTTETGIVRGNRIYEGSNHLGNVLVTFSDRIVFENGDLKPATVSYSDYYAFGMPIKTRTNAARLYKFAFQGQEAENELYGEGNASFFKYRISDNRLGRFFSIDPLAAKYPHNSPYAFSENRVIDKIELEGLETAPIPSTQEAITGTGQAKINLQTGYMAAKQIPEPSPKTKQFIKGGITATAGAITFAGGVGAASSPTGVGQVGGVYLMSTGVASFGLGIAMMTDAYNDDNIQNIPGGPAEGFGLALETGFGLKNGQAFFGIAESFSTIKIPGAGISTTLDKTGKMLSTINIAISASSISTNQTSYNTPSGSYKIKSGDTLSKIAKQYNTTVQNLVDKNNIQDADFIKAGETISL